jgi:outer membrane biosynthesis protein TonB
MLWTITSTNTHKPMAQEKRLTNDIPYIEQKSGKGRRILAWIFTIAIHLVVIILLASLKLDSDEKKKKEKQEIAFGMEVVKGKDNKGSNAANVPIDQVNPSVSTPSESSREIVTSDKSDIATKDKGKQDQKDKKKVTKKRKKATDDSNNKNKGGNKGKSSTGQKGDDKNESGNKGSSNGTVNSNALYSGNGGVGSDPNLKLSGWKWLQRPQVVDKSNARGTIVFKIIVNDDGKIERISRVSSTVGAKIVAQYAAQIKRTARFQLLNPDIEPTNYTTGTLTIVIKQK